MCEQETWSSIGHRDKKKKLCFSESVRGDSQIGIGRDKRENHYLENYSLHEAPILS